jgi:recombination protein RecA
VINGEGVSREGSILDAAVEQNVVEKSGTWFTYRSERVGQGRENAKRYLRENPKVLTDVEARVRAALGLKGTGASDKAAPADKAAPTEKAASAEKATSAEKAAAPSSAGR